MSERPDARDVDAVLQAARLQCFRGNLLGALALLEAAHAERAEARYAAELTRMRPWLAHLASREAYVAACESSYRQRHRATGLKHLEQRLRIALGRKTRAIVERRGRGPDVGELERDIAALRPTLVLDAACGEGDVAMTIAAGHPELHVEAVDLAGAGVTTARGLNRFGNVVFHEGLAEEVHELFGTGSFDLAYAFGALDCVRDVEATVHAVTTALRPGGRVCFVLAMHEFRASGPLPEYVPAGGIVGRCRVFSERELYQRFGGQKEFRLAKLAGRWRPGRFPDALLPLDFGAFYVSYTV
jgi:SAM-dependent methyltransferase